MNDDELLAFLMRRAIQNRLVLLDPYRFADDGLHLFDAEGYMSMAISPEERDAIRRIPLAPDP